MEEIWKDIKGYERRYQVSDRGNVRRLLHYIETDLATYCVRPGPQKQNISADGYHFIKISKLYKLVHHLVAAAFLPQKRKGQVITPLDGNRLNNNVTNLKSVTKAKAWKLAQKRKNSMPSNSQQSPNVRARELNA